MKVTKLKKMMQVLVFILVIDGIFLLYKYQQYKTTIGIPGKKFDWIFSKSKQEATLDKYIKNDYILSVHQANTILNPDKLRITQALAAKRSEADATDTVLFIKTHKTGSSTLQNIILRYAILHNKTIALPAYRASFFWPNKFSSYKFVRKQKGTNTFHTLAHHAIYNKQEMLKVLRPNPSVITILREPVALFRSAFVYYNMQNYCFNTTADHIRQSPQFSVLSRGVCPKTQTPVRNLQAFDLGLSISDNENEDAVKALIKDVDETMTLVLITERFDESLILLQRKFHWSMEDIMYFKQNAQIHKSQNLTVTSRPGDVDILQFNYADHLIYKHFSERLDQELKELFTDEELQQEISSLHSLQIQYRKQCVRKVANADSTFFMSKASKYAIFRPYGHLTLGYVLKPESFDNVFCRLLAMPELTLTHYLKAFVG